MVVNSEPKSDEFVQGYGRRHSWDTLSLSETKRHRLNAIMAELCELTVLHGDGQELCV